MNDDGTDREERINIDSLRQEMSLPQDLEQRIIRALKAEGLLRSRHPAISFLRIGIALAACLLFFVAGFFYSQSRAKAAPSVRTSESTFVLFLLEGPDYRRAGNSEERQKRVDSYRNWAIKLREQGVPIMGNKLQNEAQIVGKASAAVNGNEQISGYFLIDARDSREAIRIAESCPHLTYGGRIEVRRIDPV